MSGTEIRTKHMNDVRKGIGGLLRRPTSFWDAIPTSERPNCVKAGIFRSLNDLTAWDSAGIVKDRWNNELYPALRNLLNHNRATIYRGERLRIPYIFKLWMVGRSVVAACPTVVVISPQGRIAKRVVSLIHQSRELKTLGFRLSAHESQIFQPAGEIQSTGASAPDFTPHQNLCGAAIIVPGPAVRRATLGGLITIGAEFYGLTIGHTFFLQEYEEQVGQPSEPGILGQNLWDEENLGEDRWRDAAAEDELDFSNSSIVLSINVYLERSVNTIVSGAFQHESLGVCTLADKARDWALVKIDDQEHCTHNTVMLPNGQKLSPKGAATGELGGEVWAVLGTSGIFKTEVSDSICGIFLPGGDVLQDTWSMDFVAASGDSGSWILNSITGDIHGYVVATIPSLGISYLLPMVGTLDDIKFKFRGSVVELPTLGREATSHSQRGLHSETPFAHLDPDVPQDFSTRHQDYEAVLGSQPGSFGMNSTSVPLAHPYEPQTNMYRTSQWILQGGVSEYESEEHPSSTVTSPRASVSSQQTETTLDLSEMPEYEATTTTKHSSKPVVVEGVEISAHIVPSTPVTPYTSRDTKDTSLRSGFTFRKKGFFVFGKVFKVWWAEPAGPQSKGATIVTDHLGEGIATKFRWFVVVRPSESCSVCLPIQTYESKGVSKAGITKCQHAIIYTVNMKPYMSPAEHPRLYELPMKRSICVQPTKPFYKFDQMSRINYGKVYTIEHNVKVEDFGMVIQDHHYLLEASFRETLLPRTQMGNFPISQGGSASQQSDFVGIGAHSHHQISGEQNTSLEDGIPLSPNYFSASANPPTTDPASTYYNDQATGKDRETGDHYITPELGLLYTPQPQQEYYSQPTDPFTIGYGEASPTPPGSIGPPQTQYHDSYGHPPPPSRPIGPPQAQFHDNYSPSPSYRGQKRQSRYHKGRKG